MDSPELAIRMRRAAFNRALAQPDLAAIGPMLAPDAVLVAGTDSAILSGRKAQLLAWKREFAAADRTVYTRLPERIEASTVAPIALEHGCWQGVTLSGQAVASGTYTAKWRRVVEEWVIEAEIYLTPCLEPVWLKLMQRPAPFGVAVGSTASLVHQLQPDRL